MRYSLALCEWWCPEQDSNLHVSQHSHLKRARLPFRHLGFLNCVAKVVLFGRMCKFFGMFFALFCGSLVDISVCQRNSMFEYRRSQLIAFNKC